MKLCYLLLSICLVVSAEEKATKKKAKCNKRALCTRLTQLQEGQEAISSMINEQGELMAAEIKKPSKMEDMLATMQEQISEIKSALYDKQAGDCASLSLSSKTNGTYTIYPYGSVKESVPVYCQFGSDGNAWTVIQRRFDGSVDFYKGWNDYKNGFGSADGEYWLGNDVIHELTSNGQHELLIVMSDFEGVTKYARYSTFSVGDESSRYPLSVGGYTGNAGDSMSYQNSRKFSTFDKDNDRCSCNCAESFEGAWWYNLCHYSNLNGKYLEGPHKSYANGVNWRTWHNYHYSMKTTTMMIRRA